MTPFPKIQRPCPYLDRLDSVIDDGFCRMCRREVHDLTAMEEGERADFLASCGGDACVSYRMDVKPALAAALIAASAAVLVVPEAVLAASHEAARSHQRQRPVPIRLAGLVAPVVDPHGPVPIPTAPPPPPQKPH